MSALSALPRMFSTKSFWESISPPSPNAKPINREIHFKKIQEKIYLFTQNYINKYIDFIKKY